MGKDVLTGTYFLTGNEACAAGALAAGCRFFAGYPITPSSEIAERMSIRLPQVGGVYIQMEDELASMAAILGAAWAGAKSMTATSGPGISLMMENIGLGVMTETPCVVVNVMRGGPSTGLPTLVGQADVMQARWGSHGDYEIIALSPSSPQEAFDYTIRAFNLAETWRVPVILLMDEVVGHMRERVVIPEKKDIKVANRRGPSEPPGKFKAFRPKKNLIPEMPVAGQGYAIHVTGLTHDERGYPAIEWEAQEKLVSRLVKKIRLNSAKIASWEEIGVEGAEIILISYGVSTRICRAVQEIAREKGVNLGLLRLEVIWPFPEKRVQELAGRIKAFVTVEINYGQIALEVERCAAGKCITQLVGHGGGTVHDPQKVLETVEELAS
ncbi:MAG: 2-oxoacid:acceptor oxidoreductase subunit alpha [Deltaproteobacteria bacterium]|nr:2-oxoacid:acceptor oxidoreductase subunit alpha [Deltaproteobacteria bacterium]